MDDECATLCLSPPHPIHLEDDIPKSRMTFQNETHATPKRACATVNMGSVVVFDKQKPEPTQSHTGHKTPTGIVRTLPEGAHLLDLSGC